MSRVAARVGRIVLVLIAVLALPAAVAGLDVRAAFGSWYTPAGPAPAQLPAPPVHDPAKRTAVVLASLEGTTVSDALGPYEALSATGAFNVYLVAPERRPVPLTGGLDVLPDLGFAELDERLGGAAPEVVVVPAVTDVGRSSSRPLEEWATKQMGRTLMVSVCNGSGVLAAAGLFDGRSATAHWTRIGSYENTYPQVDWQLGVRWTDDGDLISSAGILSGIDATLHAIDRLLGPAAAAQAAAELDWAPRPVAQEQHTWQPSDAIVVLNGGYRWDPARIGVLLQDGVGETELAAVFDTYGSYVFVTRTIALGTEPGRLVRSRHGLVLLPRATVGEHPVDRLLVPHGPLPATDGVAPEQFPPAGVDPFDAVLHDIAATVDVPTARWVARALEYPGAGLELTGPGWPAGLILRPVLLALVGAAVVVVGTVVVGTVRRRRRTAAEPSRIS
ncbi:DJ-1/PfpI family protein [Pseudonocardia thermophila]|jgi:Transcriptional regulator containing an amidase domain and an AraC-type DNA-binding HTH domain|uniref:DJ-1/PfpI family protein n=1 Tax=Pseudonocardia thermophila TaxID=1848 RepID=UPI00248D80EE|nr:DJ-1/PfpI family protein [Pseudonocardia thermophila]